MTEMPSDEQIIEWILSPLYQNRGFEWLLKKYQERLYWHIRSIVQHHDDADDVLQNTMIKVYRYLNNFKGDSKLYTWLHRIANNEALNHIKASNKYRYADEDVITMKMMGSDAPSAETIHDILRHSVSQLPQKQRLVFQLRYIEELSYEDISEITGTSVGGLKASYHHAIKKIEQYIREYSTI